MLSRRQPARLNVRALIILVAILALLGGGAVGGYLIRKRVAASRAFAAGLAALASSDYNEAVRHLRRYLERYPDDEATLRRYADAQTRVQPLEAGNMMAAVGAYRRLLRMRPGDAELCGALMRLYACIPQAENIEYISRQRLDAAPDDVEATLWLAKALISLNKHAEAESKLTALLAKDPTLVEAYALLALIDFRDGSSIGEAKANKRLTDAVTACEAASDAGEQLAEAYVARAAFDLEIEDFDAARLDAEAAERASPSRRATLQQLAEVWLKLRSWDHVRKTIAAIDRVSAGQPNKEIDPDRLALRRFQVETQLILSQANPKESGAGALADRALAELPSLERSLFLLSGVDLYVAAGEWHKARECVDEFRAAAERANRLVQSADPIEVAEAQIAVFEAQETIVDPQSPSDKVAAAESERSRAIERLEAVLKRNPLEGRAWKLAAIAYALTGDGAASLDRLEQYYQRSPADGRVALDLARGFNRLRDWAKCAKYARAAAREADYAAEATRLRIEAGLYGGDGVVTDHALADWAKTLAAQLEQNEGAKTLELAARVAEEQWRRLISRERDPEAVDLAAAKSAECLDFWRRAAEVGDDSPLLALRHANAVANAGRTADAEQLYRKAIERYSAEATPRIALAQFLHDAGRGDEARTVIEQGLEDLTGNERVNALSALAELLEMQGDERGALARLEALAAAKPDAPGPCVRALQLKVVEDDPELAQGWLDRLGCIETDAAQQAHRIEQAKKWLHEPDWRAHVPAMTERLEAARKAEPKSPVPVLVLGKMYERLDQPQAARELYEAVYQANPGNVAVGARLATFLLAHNQVDRATEILDRLPRHVPADSVQEELRLSRIVAAEKSGDHDALIEELTERVRADAADAGARLCLATLVSYYRSDTDGALRLLDQAAAIAPGMRSVTGARAIVLASAGRASEARRLLDDAVERFADFDAYKQRAEFYAWARDFDAAEKDFRHLTTLADRQADGYLALGGFYRERGRVRDAITAWDDGLKRSPSDERLKLALMPALLNQPDDHARERGVQLLGELGESSHDPEVVKLFEATTLFDGTDPGGWTRATEILHEVVEKNPLNVTAHLLLIRAARLDGRPDEALARANQALAHNRDDVALLLTKAGLERRLENVVAARQIALSVTERDPDNEIAFAMLADMALDAARTYAGATNAADDLRAGLQYSAKAFELNRSNPIVVVVRSKALAIAGQTEEAINLLSEFHASDEGRTHLETRLMLSQIYSSVQEYDKAGAELDAAAEFAPGAPALAAERVNWLAVRGRFDELVPFLEALPPDNPGNADALVLAAQHLMRTSQERLASDVEQALRKALSISPDHPRAIDELAKLLGTQSGRVAEAMAAADRGLQRYPDDPSLRCTRGAILLSVGEVDRAREDLEACVRAARGNPKLRANGLFHLARALHAQKDEAGAKQRFEEALELDQRLSERCLTDEQRATARAFVGA